MTKSSRGSLQVKRERITQMINNSQILIVLIGDKTITQNFITLLNKNIPGAEYCQIQKPTCIGSAIYPGKTIDELLTKLKCSELQYVAILQDYYLADIPTLYDAIQKYEVEYSCKKRLLTRRIKIADKMMDYEPSDDFDLGHDFVFGTKADVMAILLDKQGEKHSIEDR